MSELIRIVLMGVLLLSMVGYPIITWRPKSVDWDKRGWFWNTLQAETILVAVLIILFFL